MLKDALVLLKSVLVVALGLSLFVVVPFLITGLLIIGLIVGAYCLIKADSELSEDD